jgi:hypothetical protein
MLELFQQQQQQQQQQHLPNKTNKNKRLRPDRPATMMDFALRSHAGLASHLAGDKEGSSSEESYGFAKSSEIWSTESHVGGLLAAIYLFAAEAKVRT